MPIYVYEVVQPDGVGGERFEVEQGMNDAPLSRHPHTGEPLRKVLTAPHLATRYTPGRERQLLDTRQVEKAGFTKYERDRLTGRYHRTAQAHPEAPATIDP
jgi:predicted nucleic acid-binding Zn ribbon protein